jgi:predicted Rossmann fold nucleotide-binding protein DprA/Smf involved in DNA uptake
VFVVPGNIDSPASAGSNALLREGAIAVMSGYDIAREYEAGFARRIDASDRGADVPVEPAETVSPFPAAQVEKQTEERKPDAQAQPAQEPVDLSPEEQRYTTCWPGENCMWTRSWPGAAWSPARPCPL